MCPSAEIWWAPAAANGLTASDTWANGVRAATILAVRSCTDAALIGPVDVITTWAGLPFSAGNALIQDLLDRLRATGEIVGEIAPGGLGEHIGAHQRHQPEDQHPPAVVVAPTGDPGESALFCRPQLWPIPRRRVRQVCWTSSSFKAFRRNSETRPRLKNSCPLDPDQTIEQVQGPASRGAHRGPGGLSLLQDPPDGYRKVVVVRGAVDHTLSDLCSQSRRR